MGSGGETHRCAGVTTVGFADGISGERTDGVDRRDVFLAELRRHYAVVDNGVVWGISMIWWQTVDGREKREKVLGIEIYVCVRVRRPGSVVKARASRTPQVDARVVEAQGNGRSSLTRIYSHSWLSLSSCAL